MAEEAVIRAQEEREASPDAGTATLQERDELRAGPQLEKTASEFLLGDIAHLELIPPSAASARRGPPDRGSPRTRSWAPSSTEPVKADPAQEEREGGEIGDEPEQHGALVLSPPTSSSCYPPPHVRASAANRGEVAAHRAGRPRRRSPRGRHRVHRRSGASWTEELDEVVCVGGPSPAESYLRMSAIVRPPGDRLRGGPSGRRERAAVFCEQNGRPTGPAPATMERGLKWPSKVAMRAAGLDLTPGATASDRRRRRSASRRTWATPSSSRRTPGAGARHDLPQRRRGPGGFPSARQRRPRRSGTARSSSRSS